MLNKDKTAIVVSLGDDGAIVSAFIEGRLQKRIFVTSSLSSDFIDLTKAFPDAVIYLLLDIIDQNYIFSNIPDVGKANVKKIVKRKLTTEFDPNDLNACMFLCAEKQGNKKSLRYLFISIRNSSPFKDWVDGINQLPNKFAGIYLIPIEAEDFIKKIRLITHGEAKNMPDEWEVLVSYNRVGGFRQIVLKNGKLIFTRISQSVSLQTPDAVGKSINQESANTLEYIRRIGFSDQNISVYIIAAKEVANFIEVPGIKPKNIYLYNPFELAQKLKFDNSAQENDKFGDVIFSTNFINEKRKLLRITTKEIEAIDSRTLSLKAITIGGYILSALLVVFSAYMLISGFVDSGKIGDLKKSIEESNKELASIEDFEKTYKIDPQELMSVVNFKKKYADKDQALYDLLQRYKKVDSFSKYIASINYITAGKATKAKADADSGAVSVAIRVFFDFSDAKNYSEILNKLEQYTTAVKAAFTDCEVNFEGLPNEKDIKVTLENADTQKKQQNFTITVKIAKKSAAANQMKSADPRKIMNGPAGINNNPTNPMNPINPNNNAVDKK